MTGSIPQVSETVHAEGGLWMVLTSAESTAALAGASLRPAWHWYHWHAELYRTGVVTAFFFELTVALAAIERRMPGSARLH